MTQFTQQAFLDYCKNQKGLSDNSLRAYAQDLGAFGRFITHCNIANALNSGDILAWNTHLHTVAKVSPATCRRRITTLKAFCKWMEQQGARP